ncbi:ricin-type beta-trefoil lectin domain protein [Zooshikella sp. RANM57]|uniref:ricin-type beta-trefoil lectin domain protein n=1 Tax=Zooshikella sp. RANM57 TaxID=3425863 RepID=UPI003D6E84E0
MKIMFKLVCVSVVLASYNTFAGEIKLVYDSRYCIHTASGHHNDGDNIHLWKCNGNSNSQWVWDGSKIRFKGSDKCLSKKGTGSASNGDNIHLWSCARGSSKNNHWDRIRSNRLKLRGTNYCINKKGSNYPKDGDNIHLWDCNKGDYSNSQWYF